MTVHIQFCLVQGGHFTMGENKEKHKNKKLKKHYWISRYPITNAQFQNFIDEEAYLEQKYFIEAKKSEIWDNGKINDWWDKWRDKPDDYGKPFDLEDHPVVGITWFEALAYVRWLEKKWKTDGIISSDWQISLPTEAQWEKAARGGKHVTQSPIISNYYDLEEIHNVIMKKGFAKQKNVFPDRIYPWGNTFNSTRAHIEKGERASTTSVGEHPTGKSPYGCEDICGNVWEWTKSLEMEYPYRPNDGRENIEDVNKRSRLIIRGGAYYSDKDKGNCSFRRSNVPYYQNRYYGFRIVASNFK